MRTTHAERNRLVIENMEMVSAIAAGFYGSKGIPRDELEAQGRLGLVQAAEKWNKRASFQTFATYRISGSIKNFIEHWQVSEQASDEELERHWHEWEIWRWLAQLS